eukprot:scaffold7785_cov73-Cylindrotheca_fusiformis.AAC.1
MLLTTDVALEVEWSYRKKSGTGIVIGKYERGAISLEESNRTISWQQRGIIGTITVLLSFASNERDILGARKWYIEPWQYRLRGGRLEIEKAHCPTDSAVITNNNQGGIGGVGVVVGGGVAGVVVGGGMPPALPPALPPAFFDVVLGALVDLDVGDLVESLVPFVLSEGDLVFLDILGPLVDFKVGDLVDFVVGDLVDLGDFKSLAMAVTQTRATKIRNRALREDILK